ncbi:MAG TPA: hypothetical protein VKA21_12265 [Candidatus Binatia bacterium]|nr:hypothetical protein [Candidatus Binatia bacterium]
MAEARLGRTSPWWIPILLAIGAGVGVYIAVTARLSLTLASLATGCSPESTSAGAAGCRALSFPLWVAFLGLAVWGMRRLVHRAVLRGWIERRETAR